MKFEKNLKNFNKNMNKKFYQKNHSNNLKHSLIFHYHSHKITLLSPSSKNFHIIFIQLFFFFVQFHSQQEEGWKLNRTNYYQEGWLATGNTRGIVGVTFSTSHCKKNVEYPQRTNYNLRGHRSDVRIYMIF